MPGGQNGLLVSVLAYRVGSRLSVCFILEFRQRLFTKLEHLGDTAMNAQRLDEAISAYSSALSLEPAASSSLLIKRSKVYVAKIL